MNTTKNFHWLLAVLAMAVPAAAQSAELVRVNAPGHVAIAPQVAVDASGAVNVVWLDKGTKEQPVEQPKYEGHGHSHMAAADVYFARSTDGGATFSAPMRVNRQEGEAWGFAVSRPQIDVDSKGRIHVFYAANELSALTKLPIAVSYHVRSVDGGRTFSAPVRVNEIVDWDSSEAVHGGLSQAHVFGTMGVAPDDSVHAYWIDARNMKPDGSNAMVYGAVSRDGGETFEKEHKVFEGEVCPCCQLTLDFLDDGAVLIGSRRATRENFRDSTVARSTDGGRTFTERTRLGGKHWQIEGCPLKPTVLAHERDNVYAAVFNGAYEPAGVQFFRSTDAGRSFSEPTALDPAAAVSDAPAMTRIGDHLFVAWHAKAGGERRIHYRVASDAGTGWSEVYEIDAPGLTGNSSYPSVAALGTNEVVLAWQQGDDVVTTRVALEGAPAAPTLTSKR